ncbi:unnamed protein product [Blepharisma stoltei]|uniref:Uncharacterized protein n=1 Tax=Blepharisma stoltei TaxID=1481888 RepID=A0AAU9IDC1_9CILI|nr:unnamed protein product [Blepharisma stoltei]
MNKKKRFYSVGELKEYINDLFAKAKKFHEMPGFRNNDACKSYKHLITICNSLAIVFMQYDLIQESLTFLKISMEVDSLLVKYGNILEKFWQGRLVMYNNFAYLYHKANQNQDCLKSLYEGHSLMVSMKDMGINCVPDLYISSNLMTFMCLWKIKRFNEAGSYLEKAANMVNNVIKGIKKSKLSSLSAQNLYGIVVMGNAGLAAKLDNNFDKAINICQEGLQVLSSDDILARPLICDLIQDFHREKHSKNDKDWLITKEFENILFITTFVPFISPNTPLIDTNELELEKSKARISVLGEEINTFIDSDIENVPETRANLPKPYAHIMNNILSKRKSQQEVPRQSASTSPGRGKIRPSTREGINRPWWENEKFIEQIVNPESRNSKSRYPSEPRVRKSIPRPQSKGSNESRKFTPGNSEIYENSNRFNFLSPHLNPAPIRNLASKRDKDIGKHIMVEFSPARHNLGDQIPIEFLPVPPIRRNDPYSMMPGSGYSSGRYNMILERSSHL